MYPVAEVERSQYASCNHDRMVRASDINIEQEPNEVSVVIESDAIIYPRAMVIYTHMSLTTNIR